MYLRKLGVCVLAMAVCAVGFAAYGAGEVDVTPDVVYGHKMGMALTFDVLRPVENAKGIGLLYVFSRGYESTWIEPRELVRRSLLQKGRFATVLDRGFTLFMVRHGSAPRFTIPEIVADMRLATQFIKEHAADYGIAPDKIGVFGNSAGGHLALMLGTTTGQGDEGDTRSDRADAVVAYYPPVDFRGRAGLESSTAVLRFDSALEEAMSPVANVTPDDAPTLLIHGDKDPTVPLAASEAMHAAFKAAGVATELIVVKGAGHGFQGRRSQDAAKALADWFEKYLR